ncbi:hypothetical protein PBI_WOES_47 [Gordonia phage Woes]|uniref:Pterin-binding domain-containing protein n=13 Tax=Woesvirus woes TaxID=1982751 RepID=A0A482JJC9_9CAUD|nr:hypothetical protein BH793_gp66 [Gordonia phage Woes]ATW61142.1 hypothetical protein SEA_ANAMIKA_47 [Gordonia phage Anamika]AVP43231.1 hypothetical protein PBI_HAIL2PITT_46 [Gordonia phage Hail2Pitt]QAX94330.1 hypothetical protein SEA_GUILLAUME_47 [Gordonia phage Guillaume]QAX94653.1 hypothetical protein SEA_HARAMBE_47 [Gordonia phage Harambe]QAX95316.1 hypothetical protein SEA_HELLO_47 [Gordonia phage Hello]QAX95408.1 hypothetical protein SEA_NEOEVIE_47 [Gordonia phage Neoevie]QBP30324.1
MIVTLKIELEDASVKIDEDALEEKLTELELEDVSELESDDKIELAEDAVDDLVSSIPDVETLVAELGGTIVGIELDEVEFADDDEIVFQ